MKKFLMLAIALTLTLSMILTSCGMITGNGENSGTDNGTNNDEISLNGISGKTAAELLLTQVRLDEKAVGGKMGLTDAIYSKGSVKAPSFDLLSSFTPLSSSVVFDEDGGKVTVDGNTWEWSNFSEYADLLSFYTSYIKSIEIEAEETAKLISKVKKEVNVTDKWIVMDPNNKLLLTVGESSETLYSLTAGNYVDVCNHVVDENGSDVYEMYSYLPYEDGDLGHIYMKYVGGNYYEFAFDYIPADGDPMRTNNLRIIVDNYRGYWNMLCLDAVAAYENVGRRFNFHNLIAKDDIVYAVGVDVVPGGKLSDSMYMASIFSPDWKNDIIKFGSQNNDVWINAAAFDGIESLRINDVSAIGSGSSFYVSYPYGDEKDIKQYNGHGSAVEAVLKNGKVLKNGDSFLDGKFTYYGGDARGVLNITDGVEDQLYVGSLTFSDNTLYSSEPTTPVERANLFFDLFEEVGIEPKYDRTAIIDAAKECASLIDDFIGSYRWRGNKIDSVDDFYAANDEFVLVFDEMLGMYESVKSLPEVDLNQYLEPLPEELDFADFSGFSYGKITIDNGVITADEMIASVPDNVLLDDGSEYVLRLGLRKYLEDGETPSELIVALHGDNETAVKYTAGSAISFAQGSNYTIPHNLAEGKYLLVAYIATADEGIRISKTVPIASVDFTNGTVESESMDITYEKVEEDKLEITSISKLYLELVLEAREGGYTAEAIYELMRYDAMNRGEVAEDVSLESYDFETKESAVFDLTQPLVAGTYRLKYSSASHDGADAYIYCVVTEEMLPTVSNTDTESGT